MSPLARKRWRIFRENRTAYYSLWIFGSMFFLSLFCELIANQRPIVVRYGDELFFPIFNEYPETTFGGDFETEADYTDEFVIEQITKEDNFAVFPLIRFDYKEVDLSLDVPAPSPPASPHYLGTDDRARDVLARLLYGFRVSVVFGFCLALFGTFLGICIGGVQGYLGGWFDLLFQRISEIWGSQNELYVLIILASIFEPSFPLLFFLLSIFGWMGLAAYVRAEFLKLRQMDFVESAIALGSTRFKVMLKHILPNALTPVITFMPFRVSNAIISLTALDFLGLGVPPPAPSLGELLSQGKANIESWWIIIAVFVVLVLTISLLNFIGEGIQKALDPKHA